MLCSSTNALIFNASFQGRVAVGPRQSSKQGRPSPWRGGSTVALSSERGVGGNARRAQRRLQRVVGGGPRGNGPRQSRREGGEPRMQNG
eukprot:7730004-Lingulodinium_polyedra.AAC.1